MQGFTKSGIFSITTYIYIIYSKIWIQNLKKSEIYIEEKCKNEIRKRIQGNCYFYCNEYGIKELSESAIKFYGYFFFFNSIHESAVINIKKIINTFNMHIYINKLKDWKTDRDVFAGVFKNTKQKSRVFIRTTD